MPRRRRADSFPISPTTTKRSVTATRSSLFSQKNRLALDERLTTAQRNTNHLVARMLDELYRVMSFSRWKDERYWPRFRDALLGRHPSPTESDLLQARAFDLQRYYFQASVATIRTPPSRAALRLGRARRFGATRGLFPPVRADHGRLRHLRLLGQNLVLRYRDATEAIRRRPREHRTPLRADARRRHGERQSHGMIYT
jgi:hypothetical protein